MKLSDDIIFVGPAGIIFVGKSGSPRREHQALFGHVRRYNM